MHGILHVDACRRMVLEGGGMWDDQAILEQADPSAVAEVAENCMDMCKEHAGVLPYKVLWARLLQTSDGL